MRISAEDFLSSRWSPSSSQEAFDSHGNTDHGRKKRSPTAYGATTASSNCIVDDAVNCNTSNCL